MTDYCRHCDVYIGYEALGVAIPPAKHAEDKEWLASHCWVCCRSRGEIAVAEVSRLAGTREPPDLTPEQIRSFLKDNVTVVSPGETLVIRAPDLTPNQMREFSDSLNGADEDGPWLPFRTIVVPGDELGVVKADSDEAFAARVAKALNSDVVRRSALRRQARQGPPAMQARTR